jgi:vacuolar-type H+-ATPase subunit E/Vma4
LRRRRFQAAIQALEAGVEETYRTYVQALKESRADGRLTPEECRRARERARERAIEIARAQGLNLLRELGPEYLDLWIARLVKKLKNA